MSLPFGGLRDLQEIDAPLLRETRATVESEDSWGRIAEFRDRLLQLAEHRDALSVAEFREELEQLSPLSGIRVKMNAIPG